ncbi:MAG: PfkB family carbohydrate kinase [Thermoproteota archaeon]|nr:PfkB family carbohydrate kinase [Thermoproteota archaeon]
MLTVFGSVALDTTRTPFQTKERILGGAATYASLSGSFFVPVSLIGIVGYDFPQNYQILLENKMDTKGLMKHHEKKTFFYDSSFDYDLSHRTTNKTELNVIENYEPLVPKEYANSKFVYLANNDPDQNLKILKNFIKPDLVVCDTIEYWIREKKNSVISMMEKTTGVIINDQEARLLCNLSNLIKCGKQILSWGPSFVIIKKGEHGVLFFYNDDVFPIPGFPIEDVVDPTGAGDSFAGGFIGYLISKYQKNFFDNLDLVKESIMFGSIMGTFAIEDFGINKLVNIDVSDILNRYKIYRNLLSLS